MSGPLDELLRPGEPIPLAPVHVRALEQDAGDHRAFVLAVWSDPGGALALHRALRPRVEATLLAELAHAPAEARERPLRFDALRLAVFPPMDEVEPAVRAFGLRRVDATGPAWHQALAHLRSESQLVGAGVPDEPASAWEAEMAHLDANDALEQALRDGGVDEPWGRTPGGPFRRLAAAMREAGFGEPTPDLDGLALVERVVVQHEPGPVRWIPPLVFQALADLFALAAQSLGRRRVEWAECEPPEEGALTPPPLVRVSDDGGFAHVPLGLELLRWCVMPIQPGERVPPLRDWVADAFR